MDSSSELPTDGDLDRVMAQALNAFYTGRSSLAATFFSRAEALAARLHNDALSLVPAWLRRWRAVSLGLQSCAVSEAAGMTRGEAPRAQIMSLHEEEAELQRGVVAVVERRASAGTTKYGMCRADEVAFHRHWLVAVQQADNLPPLTARYLDKHAPTVGYVLSVMAAHDAVIRMVTPVPLGGDEQRRLEALVLSTLDSMLSVENIFPDYRFTEEETLVAVVEHLFAHDPRSEFFNTFRARWTAAPFQAMLRVRGFSDAKAGMIEDLEQTRARRTADIAVHGLHPCGLPSCDEREATVKQFKYCGDCEEEWYCCAEHQVLHWQEHKPICRARMAAAAASNTAV